MIKFKTPETSCYFVDWGNSVFAGGEDFAPTLTLSHA